MGFDDYDFSQVNVDARRLYNAIVKLKYAIRDLNLAHTGLYANTDELMAIAFDIDTDEETQGE